MAELHHEFQCRNRNNDSKDSAGIGEIMGGVPDRHGDVSNAYVKADIDEGFEIALHMPQGIELEEDKLKTLGPSDKSIVALKLRESLYTLKQAGRLLAELLHDTLFKLDSCSATLTVSDNRKLMHQRSRRWSSMWTSFR